MIVPGEGTGLPARHRRYGVPIRELRTYSRYGGGRSGLYSQNRGSTHDGPVEAIRLYPAGAVAAGFDMRGSGKGAIRKAGALLSDPDRHDPMSVMLVGK